MSDQRNARSLFCPFVLMAVFLILKKKAMTFIEHDNRKKAKAFAEYITGQNLRKYVADKVKQYAGENVSVFDGASGSGQLEQFISLSQLTAVDIQQESILSLKQNYPNAQATAMSFFQYHSEKQCDCVVMNPPFSLKLKDLPQEDQSQISMEFPWKKSGVVDDIFVLKGLNYSTRWGFFILFPGVGYRQTEKTFRGLITPYLVEFNRITNAFDDTPIDVIFLVIDKQKNGGETKRHLVECKGKNYQIIHQDETELDAENWESIREPEPEQEPIDAIQLELENRQFIKNRVIIEIKKCKMIAQVFEPKLQESFNPFLNELCEEIQKQAI